MSVRSVAAVAAALAILLGAACSPPDEAEFDPRSHSTARASGADADDMSAADGGPSVDEGIPGGLAEGGRVEPGEPARYRTEDGRVLCFKPVSSGNNTAPMQVEVEPSVVGVGDAVRVLVRTAPGLLVGASLEFSDNEPHGGFGPPSRSDDEGVWRMVWTITPDVPPGPARVMVAAGSTQGQGATGEARFTVRGDWDGGCE